MRRIGCIGCIGTAVLALGCQTPPDGSTAFENVTVIPMDEERLLERHTVVVVDGRVAHVGPAGEPGAPAAATAIDGQGKFLMPGFAEMHGHLPSFDTDPAEVDRILFLFLSNGVTTVRGMLGDPIHLQLRREIATGTRLGPVIYAAGPAFRGTPELTAEQARARVRGQQAAGFDLLKILEGLPVDVYDAIADEAKRSGVPFGGHVPNAVGLLHALEAGQGSIDHLDGYLEALEADASPLRKADAATRSRELGLHADESKLPGLVQATLDAGASVVPTMALWETFNSDQPVEKLAGLDELKYLRQETVQGWIDSQTRRRERLHPEAGRRVIEIRKKTLKALQDGGVRIAFGTDAPQVFNVPGFSIHREMALMASAGLTPYEILRSGTHNVAEHFGSADFGQVTPGMRADLILLEGNPLEDVSNMARRAGVMAGGRWIPETEIQARLAKLAAE